jgi:hypothetical protein
MKKIGVLVFGVLSALFFTIGSANGIAVYGGAPPAAAAAVENEAKSAFNSDPGFGTLPAEPGGKVSRQITGIAKFTPVATGDFNDVNNCGPTACLNLLKYWHDVRGKQTLDSGSLKTTYKKICDLTKFNVKQGMGNTLGYAGLQAYAEQFCRAAGGDYVTAAPLSWIKRNIDHNNMVILIIKAANYDASVKGYHFVDCVGYYQPLKSNAVYLQIIDGWDHSATHYYNAKYGDVSAFYLRW